MLGSLETVWYIQPDGSLGDWRDQASRRVSVQETIGIPDFPSVESAAYISYLTAHAENEAVPTILVLPCYRTQTGKLLILDGNHKAVAAFRAKQEVRLLVFAVTGIDNPLILPDLLHEIHRDAAPTVWATRRAEIEQGFTES